jgi:hypothetical protein
MIIFRMFTLFTQQQQKITDRLHATIHRFATRVAPIAVLLLSCAPHSHLDYCCHLSAAKMANNNERNDRQVMTARDIDRMSTVLVDAGVSVVKRNRIKVGGYLFGILLCVGPRPNRALYIYIYIYI